MTRPTTNDLVSLPGDINNQRVRVRAVSDKGPRLDRWVSMGERFGWLTLTWAEFEAQGWQLEQEEVKA